MKRRLLILVLLLGTIGCDQATKQMARASLRGGPGLTFFGDLVQLRYAENPGAFLSLGAGLGAQGRFLVFIGFVVPFLAWAGYKLVRDRAMPWPRTVGWTLVVAGGAGNVVDRLVRGAVIDFIIVGLGPLHTGVFNLADGAIMAGIALLFVRGHPREMQSPPG